MTKRQKAYREFLQSDFWKELSAQAKARDKRCMKCKSKVRLQAHHVRYPEDWFKTTLDDLETLCRKCHAKEHGLIWSEPVFFFPYREPRFDSVIHRVHCLGDKVRSGRALRLRDREFLKRALEEFPPTPKDTAMQFQVESVYAWELLTRDPEIRIGRREYWWQKMNLKRDTRCRQWEWI
jgi:hypothetical protein